MERLQKVLAHAGLASRRQSEELILQGRVKVNGKVVSELGAQVDPEHDRIQLNGKTVRAEKERYIILHKPRGYLSDRDKGQANPSALDLVPSIERLYAAGRLDLNSEGLLLLTNDGELAHRVTHPRFEHEKEYLALVEGMPDSETIAQLKKGVWYEGELLVADSVQVVTHLGEQGQAQHWEPARRNESWLRIVLHEGKKREIRHMGGAVGHPVHRLIRVRLGPLSLGTLAVGKWRELDKGEISTLKSTLRIK